MVYICAQVFLLGNYTSISALLMEHPKCWFSKVFPPQLQCLCKQQRFAERKKDRENRKCSSVQQPAPFKRHIIIARLLSTACLPDSFFTTTCHGKRTAIIMCYFKYYLLLKTLLLIFHFYFVKFFSLVILTVNLETQNTKDYNKITK